MALIPLGCRRLGTKSRCFTGLPKGCSGPTRLFEKGHFGVAGKAPQEPRPTRSSGVFGSGPGARAGPLRALGQGRFGTSGKSLRAGSRSPIGVLRGLGEPRWASRRHLGTKSRCFTGLPKGCSGPTRLFEKFDFGEVPSSAQRAPHPVRRLGIRPGGRSGRSGRAAPGPRAGPLRDLGQGRFGTSGKSLRAGSVAMAKILPRPALRTVGAEGRFHGR